MDFAQVWLVVGTRPEAIKLSPVVRALRARGLQPLLVLTGQQMLDPGAFGLEAYPQLRLGCSGEPDPHAHVRKVTAALLPFLGDPPELLVVQGDTSSALGGALAGFTAGVPVAHVEAGLRTHDPSLPWPEEEYRTAIDAHAELLFAPTDLAAANLRAEGVRGQVHVTGNSGIDALLAIQAKLPPPTLHDGGLPRLLVTCHRRESWGAGLQSIAAALAEIAERGSARVDVILPPNAHVASGMRELLSGRLNVTLLGPCGYDELVRRMRDCDLVLSDSGGIQEEAPALGTPLLVLRDKTERPEGVASGNALLVGTGTARIVAEVTRLLADPVALAAMARRSLPYGDGRAAPRIAAIIAEWLERKAGLSRPSSAIVGELRHRQ
ncbi:MAG: non-hydrolyzing UDP-N-acetylglucosamine 2-epimerase [Sphingomicrobium sp.]